MSNIRYRVGLVLVLVLASAFALFPRTVTVRERDAKTGAFIERTEKHVPLKYGLDLQGGMHLALEVDESKGTVQNKSEALDRALKVVRNRIDQFGVSEPNVQKAGNDRIIVELPGIDDPERATKVVEQSAFLQFEITDKTNALEKALPRMDALITSQGAAVAASGSGAADTARKPGALSGLFATADSGKRADSAGRAAADSTGHADTAQATDLLAGSKTGPLSKLIQPGGMPGQYVVANADVNTVKTYLSIPAVSAALAPGKVIKWGAAENDPDGKRLPYTALYVLDSRPIVTGEHLIDARPQSDPIEGNVVTFTLDNEGGRHFKNETTKHMGDNMAIVLDDIVMTAPVIQSPIGTRGQITMRGSPLQEVQDLALTLRAGALPVPLRVVEVRSIGASLGQDSIRSGMHAGVAGILLVVLIMIGYYRFSGVLAVTALILYVIFTLALLAGFNAVLTLPGLAGLVLSVGIAVDANVLIFERIREELVHGKTVRASIDEGFKHAMSAIIDSNVSTALTAAVLYQFGTGPVKGFAVTLIAGIAASMVSAIFVVRTFFLLWLQRTRGAQTLSI